jgi:hypothetical protein
MPLYAGLSGVDPDIPDGGGSDLVVAWREDVGTINATWTDPTGVVWPLSDISPDRGFFTTNAIAGWGAQPYEIVTDPMSRGGESVRFIRPQPARLTWPLHIWGDTHQQFVDRYRALRKAFLMTVHKRQPGTLTVARPDGSARAIDAFYQEGWTGEAGQNWLSASPVVTLFCPDGAWRDVQQTVVTRVAGNPSSFFTNFPAISVSQVLGATVVTNPGDVTAWPTWAITGPCTAVTATNATTGQTFTLTATLTAGQVATITTDRPTVRGPSGENLVGGLNWPAAFLWGLDPGDNSVTFTVAGATSDTQIQLSFYPRYEGS